MKKKILLLGVISLIVGVVILYCIQTQNILPVAQQNEVLQTENENQNELEITESENEIKETEIENQTHNEAQNVVPKTEPKNEAEKQPTVPPVTTKEFSYGFSENGRDLKYTAIYPQKYQKTILMLFAIHGYEDLYNKDGQVLVNLAENLIDVYKQKNEEQLNKTKLIIIPCANPDGLYDGKSNHGYGRCNAKGIDLNRDFDALHKVDNSARNYTQFPFSAKESRAIRDLIQQEKPDIVLDFHGWENSTIGDGKIAQVFEKNLNLKHKTEFNERCNGYFSYWAHLQGADSLLVEFKDPNIKQSKVEQSINELIAKK